MKYYYFNPTIANFDEITDWCEEQFGPDREPYSKDCRWYIWYGMIKFVREEDYSWCLLKWS